MRIFIKILCFFFCLCIFASVTFSQKTDLEFNLDINAKTLPLSIIFSPSIDLSGRGYHTQVNWPYSLASKEIISRWYSEIGFQKGLYRIYFNLWELQKVENDPLLQQTILSNYEKIIKIISDSAGKIILVLYGTPPGWGKVLDKRSFPMDLKLWQDYIRLIINYFSAEKKYPVWYEVWSAPDSESFFLGTEKDYFTLYEATAKVIKELKAKNKINIMLGGPGSSWWFQNIQDNSIFSAERSLIYGLIKFCSQKKLPLDFISWHAFSDDPLIECERTVYGKTPVQLIRAWLEYFNFNKDTPLIISEWNYDAGYNWDELRSEKSYVTAGFMLSRLKSMYETGIDYQTYFCLEDFQNNKEGINVNRGVFSYSTDNPTLSNAKSLYNIFLFLNQLGDRMYGCFSLDEFAQILVTRRNEDIIVILWNYIDPYLGRHYLFRNITLFNEKERKFIIDLFKSLKLEDAIYGKNSIPLFSENLRSFFKKAQQLQHKADTFKDKKRYIKLNFTNFKGNYLYQRYTLNAQCNWDCQFLPTEEKIVAGEEGIYQDNLEVAPYSVELIIFKKEIT